MPEGAAKEPQVDALVCPRRAAQCRVFLNLAPPSASSKNITHGGTDCACSVAGIGRGTAITFVIIALSSHGPFRIKVVGGGGSKAGLETSSYVAMASEPGAPAQGLSRLRSNRDENAPHRLHQTTPLFCVTS